MYALSIFDLFSSFSIQHTTVHQAWYTSHADPLILLPVIQGMERQKDCLRLFWMVFFPIFIYLLSLENLVIS